MFSKKTPCFVLLQIQLFYSDTLLPSPGLHYYRLILIIAFKEAFEVPYQGQKKSWAFAALLHVSLNFCYFYISTFLNKTVDS